MKNVFACYKSQFSILIQLKQTIKKSLPFCLGYGSVFLLSSPKQSLIHKILHFIITGIAIKNSIPLLKTQTNGFLSIFLFSTICLLISSTRTIQNSSTASPVTIPYTSKVPRSFFLTIRNIEIEQRNRSKFWKISGWLKENELTSMRHAIQFVSKNPDVWENNFSGFWKISGTFSKTLSQRLKAQNIEETSSIRTRKISIEPFLARWAILRAKAKHYLNTRIQKGCKHHDTASFLQMILLGSANHREIKALFALAGISHLLVISGLHFHCIVQIITWIFQFIPFPAIRTICEFAGYTTYFLLLGPTPPATRAYLSALSKTIAKILKRKIHPFDEFGICLLFSVFFDPFSISSLSYQFSYLATAALFFTNQCQNRTPSHNVNVFSKIKKKVGISLGVFTTLLPLQLATFGTLPLLSIFLGLIFGDLLSFLIAFSVFAIFSDRCLPVFLTEKTFSLLSNAIYVFLECLWWCEPDQWQICLHHATGTYLLFVAKCMLIWMSW